MSDPGRPNPGDRCTVTVTDIAFGGEGVARWHDYVLFIPFVAIGEEVDVEITEAKSSYGRARPLVVHHPSPDRVPPECRYFGECGGCQYQHLRYETQLKIKHKQVADLFQRIGGFDPGVVAPVVPCPAPYHYRNRIMVRAQWNRLHRKINVGFLRHNNRLVLDVDECKIAEPALNKDLARVREDPPRKNGVKAALRLMPSDWDLHADSFFQNNFHLLPGMVEAVRKRFLEGGAKYLVDVYCGVGFFSLELADLVERFVGVELDKRAIHSARVNAQRRGVANGEWVQGQAEIHLPSLLNRFQSNQTSVILDPPRKGCYPEMLDLLLQVRPRQILYVSCHPATLARDLNTLCEDGVYKLANVTPLDMFPQTQHVECVTDLRLHGEDSTPPPPADIQ